MPEKDGYKRRKLLRASTALTGATAISARGLAKKDTREAGDIHFSRINLFHDVPVDDNLAHIDPIGLTSVDNENQELYVLSDDKSIRDRLVSKGAVVESQGLHGLPTTLYKGRSAEAIPVNGLGFLPHTFLTVSESYNFPTVNVKKNEDGTIRIKSGNHQTRVPTQSEATLELPTTSVAVPNHVKERHGLNSTEMVVSPKLKIGNYGRVTANTL